MEIYYYQELDLMKTSISLQDLSAKILTMKDYRRDYIVPQSCIEMSDRGSMLISLEGLNEFSIRNNAHTQISEKLGINGKYYQKMLMEKPSLLADNVNTWLGECPDTCRFVRTLFGHVRAVLSDMYQPIDSCDILEQAVFPVMAELGLGGDSVASCYMDDYGERMYIKVVNRKIQGEVAAGDVLQSGFIVSNSETGNGSAMVRPFIERLVCTNGLIVDELSARKNHVSRRRQSEGESYHLYSDLTKRQESEVFVAKIRDLIRAANTQAVFDRVLDKMREAKTQPIHAKKAIEVTADRFGLSEEESGGVLQHLIMGGDLTVYGLMNAYTRQSQDIEDYERATEFERLGNRVLNLEIPIIRELATV